MAVFVQDETKTEAKPEVAAPADPKAAAAKPAATKPAAKGADKAAPAAAEGAKKRSPAAKRKLAKHTKGRVLASSIEDQFTTGRLYAVIASRPGQSGRADGYILEGRELEFYLRKMQKGKKGKKE